MTLFERIQTSCETFRISACVELGWELGVALTGRAPTGPGGAQMLSVFLPRRFTPLRFTREFVLKSIPADPQAFSTDERYDRRP
jgi:hypothetical protein